MYGRETTLIGCTIQLVILAVVAFVGTISLEYTVETWAGILGQGPVDVPAGNPLVWVAGLFTSEIMIPAALITYVLVISGVL